MLATNLSSVSVLILEGACTILSRKGRYLSMPAWIPESTFSSTPWGCGAVIVNWMIWELLDVAWTKDGEEQLELGSPKNHDGSSFTEETRDSARYKYMGTLNHGDRDKKQHTLRDISMISDAANSCLLEYCCRESSCLAKTRMPSCVPSRLHPQLGCTGNT